jgi:hypothetical protein
MKVVSGDALPRAIDCPSCNAKLLAILGSPADPHRPEQWTCPICRTLHASQFDASIVEVFWGGRPPSQIGPAIH